LGEVQIEALPYEIVNNEIPYTGPPRTLSELLGALEPDEAVIDTRGTRSRFWNKYE